MGPHSRNDETTGAKAGIDGEMRSARGKYDGYVPLAHADLPFDEDVEQGAARDEVDKGMLRDAAHTPYLNLLIAALFAALFVAFFVWMVLVALCKVDHFCEMFDRSTLSTSQVTAAALRVPSVYLWVALAASAFAISVAAAYATQLMREPVGTARLVEVATHIYECSHALLNVQLKAYLPPVIILFVLVGLFVDWLFSGGLLFGSLISKMVATVCVSVATRGNLRTAAAARTGFYCAARVAFRSGASIGLSVVGLSLLGNGSIYLMMEDVRVLIAFAAGASAVAFVCRIFGAVYTTATNMGAGVLNNVRKQNKESMADHLPLRFLATGGDCLGDISGMGIDLLESFCSAISVCAILGAVLPFYSRDPFALCVFNHLNVDLKCGAFGYPQRLSYATYICRANNMYQEYPVLSVWQSNSTFIAIPYLVGTAVIAVSLLCSIRMYTPKDDDANNKDGVANHSRRIKRTLLGFRINALVGAIAISICAATICFAMLGPSSAFQRAKGFGTNLDLPRFKLENGPRSQICRAQYQNASKFATAFPIPHGEFVNSSFSPISIQGYQFVAAASTAARLFGCILLGIILALLLEYSNEFFTSPTAAPVRRVAESAEYGAAMIVVQGIATGMLSTIPPVILVGISILISYAVFEQYGVALMSIGLVSLLGIVTMVDSFGYISSSAGQMAKIADLPPDVQDVTAALEVTGRTGSAIGKLHASASAIITSVALLSAFVSMAGLAPQGRDIIGSTEIPGTELIFDVIPVSMMDMRVRLCMCLGVVMPFLFAGLLLGSGTKAANAMVVGTRRHVDEVEKTVREGGFAKAKLTLSLSLARKASMMETILPMVVVFLSPLVVGFSFGQKCLIAFAITTSASIFLFATLFANTGEIWTNALRLIELGELGEGHGRGSEWHEHALVAESLGKSLKETAGSAMSILMKLVPYLGFLFVKKMFPDGERGWIGACIFAALIVFIIVFAAIKRRWNLRMMKEARSRTEKDVIKPPALKTPPFYQPPGLIEPHDAVAGSQLHEAMAAAGSPTMAVESKELPGLATRDVPVVAENGYDVSSLPTLTPRGRLVTEGVVKDAVRDADEGQN